MSKPHITSFQRRVLEAVVSGNKSVAEIEAALKTGHAAGYYNSRILRARRRLCGLGLVYVSMVGLTLPIESTQHKGSHSTAEAP